jgi:mxaJ protein
MSVFTVIAFALAVVAFQIPGCGSDTPHPPTTTTQASNARELRVCADPNNLPFSNERGEGFENKIAELVAGELAEPIHYTWWAQRRGFLRHTLNARACDVVIGLPSAMDMTATTKPYYRSTYVFVTRRDRHLRVRDLEDPRLHQLRIGVQLIGDDGMNSPPAHALSRRGIIENVVGFSVIGDYNTDSPPSRIVSAVADDEVDVAVAWGPLAGYFASRQPVALDVTPVPPVYESRELPFSFSISMGVRKDDSQLRLKLNDFIDRRRPDIERILEEFHVPQMELVPGGHR